MATIAFPQMFNISTGQTQIATGKDSVQQQIKCSLLTNINEMFGDPPFGSELKTHLFRINNKFYEEKARQCIQECVRKYVKEATSIRVSFTTSEYDNHRIHIIIQYEETFGNIETIELAINSSNSLQFQIK